MRGSDSTASHNVGTTALDLKTKCGETIFTGWSVPTVSGTAVIQML